MKSTSSFRFARATLGAAATFAVLLLVPHSTFAQRLPTTVIPAHYTLKLTPDLRAATFSGEETIDVNISQATRSITLNAIEINFLSVTIFPNGPQETGTVTLDAGKQQATFTFPNTVPAGNASHKDPLHRHPE